RVIANATLGRTPADVVLDPPACENVDRAVVLPYGKVDGQLTLDVAQASASIVGEADHVGRRIKTPLGGLEGGDARFDRHLGISIVLGMREIPDGLRPTCAYVDNLAGREWGPCPAGAS